jgi:hypothetical protein
METRKTKLEAGHPDTLTSMANLAEICDRELDDGGLKLLVRWKGGEETWEL